MFLVNSRLGLFTAALSLEHPFSRSYGVILPSSLTMVLSLALGFSPHLPVLVCGTGTSVLTSGFSRQCEIGSFGTWFPPHHRSALKHADLPTCKPFCLDALDQRRALLILLRPHFAQTYLGGRGISTCRPSPTALALSLGPD